MTVASVNRSNTSPMWLYLPCSCLRKYIALTPVAANVRVALPVRKVAEAVTATGVDPSASVFDAAGDRFWDVVANGRLDWSVRLA